MKSKICKLIITLSISVFAFLSFNLIAFADPLTSAFVASSAGMGFGWSSFAGMPSGVSSDIADRAGFSGLQTWQDLSGDGVYIKVTEGTDKDTVVLGPDISQAAYDRARAFAYTFNLNPGEVHNFGNVMSINGYYFSKQIDSTHWRGPIIGYLDGATHFGIANDVYCDISYNANIEPYSGTCVCGNSTKTNNIGTSNKNAPLYLQLRNSTNPMLYFYMINPVSGQHIYITYFSSINNLGVYEDKTSVSVSRSNDSEIINPNSGEYQFSVPHESLSGTGYIDGENIYNKFILEQILSKLEEIADDENIDDLNVLPPPGPTPGTDPIGDHDWDDLGGYLDDITNNQNDLNDLIGDESEIIDDIHDLIVDNNTIIDDIKDLLGDPLTGIKTKLDSIIDYLDGIYEYVADIVQEIVNADANWVTGLLNNFLSQFQSWFDNLRTHVSIWHYVVEWLSSIGTCFTFFFGCLNSTGYNFVLPFYACFAGTVVIAVYRRFGK